MEPPPNQFTLTPPQRTLHDALAAKGGNLASIYFGALHVLTSAANPERFSQSAQSFRELIQRLWVEYDPTSKKKDMSLKDKAKQLEESWSKIRKRNGKTVEAAQMTTAEIDGFFVRLDDFFAWNAQFLPRRGEQASRAIANMDPMLGKLPTTIMSLRVKESQTLRDYFEKVAHHNYRPASDSEFQSYVTALEKFLLERLRPRTGENFAEIQKLIQEGEASA
jgi:hypothetical protein